MTFKILCTIKRDLLNFDDKLLPSGLTWHLSYWCLSFLYIPLLLGARYIFIISVVA